MKLGKKQSLIRADTDEAQDQSQRVSISNYEKTSQAPPTLGVL